VLGLLPESVKTQHLEWLARITLHSLSQTGSVSLRTVTICSVFIVCVFYSVRKKKPYVNPNCSRIHAQRMGQCSVNVVLGVVHRQGGDSCYECDRCACAGFRGEWCATTHPKSIRTVHRLTTSY
jgi:hypothetical protein